MPTKSESEDKASKTASKVEESKEKTVKDVKYSKEELAYRSMWIGRLESAKNQRDAKHPEFDDMDYLTHYESNSKAANAYTPPKRNKVDTRIVTGTTREKEGTLLSALLNYNLEPNVEAFDKDDLMISHIGSAMEDMIKKSREIEGYDDKRPLIYREALDQGDAFCEEVWIERTIVEKELQGKKIDFSDLKSIRWDKKLTKSYGQCEARLRSGTQVYFGNIKEFDEWEQPYGFTVEIMPYSKAKSIYGKWERWENVPKTIKRTEPASENNIEYRDWSLTEVENDMVEVIKAYDPDANEMAILLNGVNMLPMGFPLTAVSPSGKIPVVKLPIEPISKFFLYSNSVPSKTKVDQALMDEMIRSIVTIFQQKVKPPMANNTGRALSKKIFDPGHIQPNIDPNKLSPILQNQGLSSAEFAVFDLIKQIVDEKTTSPGFSGQSGNGNQTATEVVELKKQAMMKLGTIIWGVVRFERRMAWLRLHNILTNWTKPISSEVDKTKKELKDVFRTMTVKSTLEDGREGRKIISFNPEMANSISPEQIASEEEFLSEKIPTRKVYINPNELRNLKANWFITIQPTEKDSSALDRVLYTQNLTQAAQLFGPQSLNMNYHKQRFAILAKEDPEQYFLPEAQQMQPQQGQQGPLPKQQADLLPQQPSINTLVQA